MRQISWGTIQYNAYISTAVILFKIGVEILGLHVCCDRHKLRVDSSYFFRFLLLVALLRIHLYLFASELFVIHT